MHERQSDPGSLGPGALGRRAEEIYSSLDQDGQDASRQLFLRLVTLGEGAEDTRRRVMRSKIEGLEQRLPVNNERSIVNGERGSDETGTEESRGLAERP